MAAIFWNIITRQKLIFFSGSISRSIYLTNMHLSRHFHDFSQKCTLFSHNYLTSGYAGSPSNNRGILSAPGSRLLKVIARASQWSEFVCSVKATFVKNWDHQVNSDLPVIRFECHSFSSNTSVHKFIDHCSLQPGLTQVSWILSQMLCLVWQQLCLSALWVA